MGHLWPIRFPQPPGAPSVRKRRIEVMGVSRRSGRMYQRVAGGAEWMLARSPVQLAMNTWRRRLAVLAYHGVDDPVQLARHLDWLGDHAAVVSLEQVTDAVRFGAPLPPRAVLLTFDDGEPSVLDHGAPLLRERGMPAVAFVVAGLVDTDTAFWWTEVEELATEVGADRGDTAGLVRRMKALPDGQRRHEIERLRERAGHAAVRRQLSPEELRKLELDGIAVGNHSLTHPCLDRCDDTTLRTEVHQAHEVLTEMLGHPPTAFAYPNGNVDGRVRGVVASAGYTTAFGFDHRLVSRHADPLCVSRVRVDSSTRLDRFRTLVSGVHPALHHLRGRS